MRRNAARRLGGPLTAGLLILTATLSSAAPVVLVPENLGILADDPPSTFSAASLINRNGQVTGNSGARVFSWTESGGIEFVAGDNGGFTSPRGINDSGQVVGTVEFSFPNAYAFSWTSAGGLVILGTLGGSFASAAAVNAVVRSWARVS